MTAVHLQRGLWTQNGRRRALLGRMVDAGERGLRDEIVVHKELATHVDGDDVGWVVQVGEWE